MYSSSDFLVCFLACLILFLLKYMATKASNINKTNPATTANTIVVVSSLVFFSTNLVVVLVDVVVAKVVVLDRAHSWTREPNVQFRFISSHTVGPFSKHARVDSV